MICQSGQLRFSFAFCPPPCLLCSLMLGTVAFFRRCALRDDDDRKQRRERPREPVPIQAKIIKAWHPRRMRWNGIGGPREYTCNVHNGWNFQNELKLIEKIARLVTTTKNERERETKDEATDTIHTNVTMSCQMELTSFPFTCIPFRWQFLVRLTSLGRPDSLPSL